jgi:hypothetical protein
MISTAAFTTLTAVEHARRHPESTIEIVKETSRYAIVSFDLSYAKRITRLSKRNKAETSALGVVHEFLNGELPRYA